MNQERKEVLDLLAQGKITASEAAEMLARLRSGASESPVFVPDETELIDRIEIEGKGPEPGWDELKPVKATEEYLPALPGNGDRPRWLRIRVSSLDTGKNRVNINIPYRLVSFGLGIARRLNVDTGEVDLDQLAQMAQYAEKGMLIDVQDEEDNEHVQIYLE